MNNAPDNQNIKDRLEYLRGELREARLSYGELSELQGLAPHIDKGDPDLLEAAGVPEEVYRQHLQEKGRGV